MPVPAAEQVHHLLWVLTKLDEIVPVVHARFAGATMQQKYGSLMGDTSEPFVLGGNPLLAVHANGGETAVDQWIDSQSEWSKEELAQMLRELAIEIASKRVGFAVVHYSVQSDHLHLLIEADGNRSLARGIQALCVRLARNLNKLLGRRGTVFGDRYHLHVLSTPREAHHAVNRAPFPARTRYCRARPAVR